MLAVDREASYSGPLATVTEEESLLSTATESTTDNTGTAFNRTGRGGGGGGGGWWCRNRGCSSRGRFKYLGIVTM